MSRPSLLTIVAVLLLATLAAMALAVSERARLARPASTPVTTRPAPVVAAPPAAVARPRRIAPRSPKFTIVRVQAGRAVTFRARPAGAVIGHLGATTSFGSPDVLSVAAVRGPWLGVTTSAAPNGQLAWVDGRSRALTPARTNLSLSVSLTRRRLELRQGRRILRAIEVGIGRPGSDTPTGRFAITDKLVGAGVGSYYGCCILALSGHQPNTPVGWQGSDRLAIHGTDDPSSIGSAASAGCLHAEGADLRVLMRRVPLGTPVFIRQ